MSRFEAAGDAFLSASRSLPRRESAADRGEPMPDYLTQYPANAKLIYLPSMQDYIPPKNDLKAVIVDRRTNRRYDTNDLLTVEQFSWLLWASQGMVKYSEKTGLTLRNVPSAGSRHPFDTYLLIDRVESLTTGLYHYVPQEHAIYLLNDHPEIFEAINASTFNQKHVINASVIFIWVAEVYRTSWRYTERAYRYLFLDAGHVCQNLYLCAESIDYGVCAIAAFDDRLANQLLGLDEVERFLVYAASVGKKIH